MTARAVPLVTVGQKCQAGSQLKMPLMVFFKPLAPDSGLEDSASAKCNMQIVAKQTKRISNWLWIVKKGFKRIHFAQTHKSFFREKMLARFNRAQSLQAETKESGFGFTRLPVRLTCLQTSGNDDLFQGFPHKSTLISSSIESLYLDLKYGILTLCVSKSIIICLVMFATFFIPSLSMERR